MKQVLLLLVFGLTYLSSLAQTTNVEMADGLRANGKIYVVVAVCITILIGLFAYVFSIDRKISRIEEQTRLRD